MLLLGVGTARPRGHTRGQARVPFDPRPRLACRTRPIRHGRERQRVDSVEQRVASRWGQRGGTLAWLWHDLSRPFEDPVFGMGNWPSRITLSDYCTSYVVYLPSTLPRFRKQQLIVTLYDIGRFILGTALVDALSTPASFKMDVTSIIALQVHARTVALPCSPRPTAGCQTANALLVLRSGS